MKGHRHTEKTRAKISASKKGQTSPNKGRTFSKEWREKLSAAHRGIKNPNSIAALRAHHFKGKEHPMYVHGLTADPEFRSWQKNQWHSRKKQNGGEHTWGEWQTLKAQYNWTCPACKVKEPSVSLTEDHIIPISKGGSNNIENIQPLCLTCNLQKHTKIIRYDFNLENESIRD